MWTCGRTKAAPMSRFYWDLMSRFCRYENRRHHAPFMCTAMPCAPAGIYAPSWWRRPSYPFRQTAVALPATRPATFLSRRAKDFLSAASWLFQVTKYNEQDRVVAVAKLQPCSIPSFLCRIVTFRLSGGFACRRVYILTGSCSRLELAHVFSG